MFFGQLDHGFKVGDRLGECVSFRRKIAVMETIIWDTEFLAKLEVGMEGFLRCLHRGTSIPLADPSGRPKHVRTATLERVPVSYRKAEMLGHGLAADFLLRIEPFERKRIPAARAFIPNGGLDEREVGFHRSAIKLDCLQFVNMAHSCKRQIPIRQSRNLGASQMGTKVQWPHLTRTTESLRTSENTEPLEEFSLDIPFHGIFSGFSATQYLSG